MDDHATVIRNVASWFGDLRKAVADAEKSHLDVAHHVVMAGGVAPADPADNAMSEYEAWYSAHRRTFGTALIRLLKRHRRWAPVKRILTANWDPRVCHGAGDHIITPEFHADYLAWLNSVR
jgi:hypothetical protein